MESLIILFTIFITITGYVLSRNIFARYKHPLLNPVFLTTVIVITILLLTGLDFNDYKPGKEIMTFLLGPATVALALPLYKNRQYLWSGLIPILLGVGIGSLVNIVTVIVMAHLTSLEKAIVISLAPKSITAPIAIEVSKIIGGDPALAVVFVVATGMIGAIMGSSLLSLIRVKDPVARGLAIGTTSHGQGTAIALQEGETQGAMSGIAMALAAVFTSFAAPSIVPFLLRVMF